MKPIMQEKLREIVSDFAQAIREKKTKTAKPAFDVIHFRNDLSQKHERPIEYVSISNGRLVVDDPSRLLTGRHHSQMSVWGFRHEPNTNSYIATADEIFTPLQKITKYLSRYQISLELSQDVELAQEEMQRSQDELTQAVEMGALFKSGATESVNVREFTDFLTNRIPRRLKEHQLKAALHLLAVRNGANFSVPGSGKTTVVLAVFDWLRSRGEVDSLFVVGPPSCFAPWRMEYEAVVGKIKLSTFRPPAHLHATT